MLDRLEEFRKVKYSQSNDSITQLAQKEGVSLNLNESLIVEEGKNNDRELIEDFLLQVKEVQKLIVNMSKKNIELKELTDAQINENKSTNQQSKLLIQAKVSSVSLLFDITLMLMRLIVKTDQINEVVQLNAKYQKKIKESLDLMTTEIEESQKQYPEEPETRVKKTVHRTLTSKFRDVLRQSQQIQTEYKNAMQSKIKRQIKFAKADATEEELEQLSRDPEAAQKLIREKVIGPAHRKIQNTVDDIQNKYKDILRLEQVREDSFRLSKQIIK